MQNQNPILLTRDVDAILVPMGTKVTLRKDQPAHVTQALGGSYTVVVHGNTYQIDGKDADALGLEGPAQPVAASGAAPTREELEKQVWNAMRTCYDPEIPINIVDLGLIYDCTVSPLPEGDGYRADIKMTLTTPGCGMGPMIAQQVQSRVLSLDGIDEANVELVWDPPWNQNMISEAARLQLGLY
jgi:probable FeS assembly SUF system protein SufT